MQTPTNSHRGKSRIAPPFLVSGLVAAAVFGGLSLVGCGGGGGGTPGSSSQQPTPTPAAIASATPTPAPTGTSGTPTPSPAASATPSVAPVLVIAPASTTLSVGDTGAFAASEPDTGNPLPVIWSVQEGSGGGTVSADGVYSAPAVPGTYHLIAASQTDASRTGSATVIVQAGDAAGTIQ